MKTYRVAICFEEGVVVTVKANNEEEAESKADKLADDYGGTDYPTEYNPDCVHREWFTQNAEEVKNDNDQT